MADERSESGLSAVLVDNTKDCVTQNDFVWRIFPPPTADPRRDSNKMKKKKKKKGQAKTSENPIEVNRDGGNQHPEDALLNKGTELWRHKQQQYQYSYPYKVGEIVRMLVPPVRKERQALTKDYEHPKPKKQKLSKDDEFTNLELESTNNIENNGNRNRNNIGNGNNQLVAGLARVDKIEENPGRKSCLHVTRQSDHQRLVLSPKEQRKLLCPELATKTCTVVLVEETLPFRHVARLHLGNSSCNRVLEIGCSTGELSKLLWRNLSEDSLPTSNDSTRPSSWIGMDHSQEMIDRCKKQLDQHRVTDVAAGAANSIANGEWHAKVMKVDCLEEPRRAAKEATTPSGHFPNVVLIDIGGNRECAPVVKTMKWVFATFGRERESADPLRMVIVKSRALVRQLRSDAETSRQDENETTPGLDASTGMVSKGTEWFKATHERLCLVTEKQNRYEQRFKHPLKAPKVLSPIDGLTPICRYHNYHKDGCKLYNDRDVLCGTKCLFDHDHCHSCLQKGHVAKNCPNRDKQSCY